jgi:hypothetical protein
MKVTLPVYQFTSNEIDVGELRARLQKMTDETLLRFGRAAAYMCSPQANSQELLSIILNKLTKRMLSTPQTLLERLMGPSYGYTYRAMEPMVLGDQVRAEQAKRKPRSGS